MESLQVHLVVVVDLDLVVLRRARPRSALVRTATAPRWRRSRPKSSTPSSIPWVLTPMVYRRGSPCIDCIA